MLDFFKKFNYEVITIQCLHKDKPTLTYSVPIDNYPFLIEKLTEKNKEGYQVYFMVNEGDGVTKNKGSTVRNKAAVTFLTSLFIDSDECSPQVIRGFLTAYNIEPHLVVESSPNKFHYYFLIQKTEKDSSSLAKWKACQKALMFLGDHNQNPTGCDTSMHDESKLLRVPNFYHLKSDPFLTRIRKERDIPLYTLDELFVTLQASRFFKRTFEKFDVTKEKFEEGERHQTITQFLGSLIHKNVEPRLALESLYGYIQLKFKDPKQFLPGGLRHKEVLDAYEYVLNSYNESLIEESIQVLEQHYDDPYSLPESFYLDCPGIAGKMIREINDRSFYKSPSIVFGTVVGLLGTLKSHHVSPSGLTASNYFITIADTGRGKNYAQQVLTKTFTDLGITDMLSNRMRSEQGFYKTLQRGEGRVLLMIDEFEAFFQALSDESNKSPAWLKECHSLLLKLYTSTNTSYFSTGDTVSQSSMTFYYPCLNLLAFGVPSSLRKAFNKSSLTSGFLSRCIILSEANRKRYKNTKAQKAEALNGEIGSYLRVQHTAMKDYFSELRDDTSKPLKEVAYEEGVHEKLENFENHLNDIYNKHIDQGTDDLAPLYTRGTEQVVRLSLALADDVITHEIIDYCIKFISTRIKATEELIKREFKVGILSEKMEILQKSVARVGAREGRPATKRDIFRNVSWSSIAEAEQIIQACVKSNMIKQVTHRKRIAYVCAEID